MMQMPSSEQASVGVRVSACCLSVSPSNASFRLSLNCRDV